VTTTDLQPDPVALGARFPADFSFGFAASAYQIEGAATEDGRGPSVWDTFSRVPGSISDGETGDVACDHYHRYRDDVALMAGLGAREYRFSVAWTRIQPNGTGAADPRGLDFYDRLVDALLAAGIRPLVNLFHWDLPQALQDEGGFANPEIVDRFAEYADIVAARLGDRVSRWMTLNEPAVYAYLGHADGIHAPGLRDWPTAIRVADNEIRAHAAATAALRARVPNARVGIAFDQNQVVPADPASDADRRAAVAWSAARDAWFLDPFFGRGYPSLGIQVHAEAGHLDGVELAEPPGGDLDYLGLNYYRRDAVRALSDQPFDFAIEPRPGTEQTQMDWEVAPDGLRDTLQALHATYAPREILITENGAAYPDTMAADGRVHDEPRIAYLARHIAAVADARDAGVPVSGYHAWSLLDNYEWSLGYSRRFGLIYVDYATQRRTPKDSAVWFSKVIAAGS
jgi:beta-glucosidase